jgi:hypothetical protein
MCRSGPHGSFGNSQRDLRDLTLHGMNVQSAGQSCRGPRYQRPMSEFARARYVFFGGNGCATPLPWQTSHCVGVGL